MPTVTERFFADLPGFHGFDEVLDAARYRPVPQDWSLAVADVEGSTAAIAAGRYKEVNLAGAAVICAVQNAVGGRSLPFAFGGDGALVALGPAEAPAAAEALARVRAFVSAEVGLGLRAGLVPVADIRAAGRDVRLARHEVGEVGYAMFDGGGARWADAELKAGRYAVAPAGDEQAADLTGLSCRWAPVPARNGVVLSVIAEPGDGGAPAFARVASALLALLTAEGTEGHPVGEMAPPVAWPPAGLELERRARNPASRGGRGRILFEAGVARAADAAGRPVGGFDARLHRADIAANCDYRKFDDGLKLTVDVPPALAARIETLLADACREGACRYGTHRQDEALITCIVPSFRDRDHLHFIDGAAGGYALAAAAMKGRA